MPDLTPPHAYVPSQTARHPEGFFDAVRDTARMGMSVADLQASDAWRVGLRYYRDGFYWEAHEVLEPVWMALPGPSPERAYVQGVIQLANAALKVRMGRKNAARRLCEIALTHLASARGNRMGQPEGWLEGEVAHVEQKNAL